MLSRRTRKKQQQYKMLYGQKEYDRDERSFDDSVNQNKPIDMTVFKRLMTHDLCINTNILHTGYIGNINLQDIHEALKHPQQSYRLLVEASKELMHISPHYFRLNTLYSNMALFCWWIRLYDVNTNANYDALKRAYKILSARFENMNLKHEFSKIFRILPYQDIYCGLVVENDVDFFFQEIDYRYCRLYEVQDGLYNFQIDLSAINANKLNAFPSYVQQAWLDFRDGKNCQWYLPPADKQICVKFNSQWTYPFPLLLGLVQDILDLDLYKKLKLQSARTDNYKAIMIQVPTDTTKVDKLALSPEMLQVFAEMNKENMSDDIGLIHTPGSKGEAISFKDSSNTRNNVSDAVDELYNSAGNTKELFNGSSSATAVTLSVENDAGFVYSTYRQLERWCNRYIKINKYNKKAYHFQFYLLDITTFNRDTVIKRYKEAGSMGLPIVDRYLASVDMTPSTTFGSYVLHNDIFDFYTNFKPLTSSYNSTTKEKSDVTEITSPGRPTNAENGELLSDEGEKSADGDKNDR